MMKKAWIMILLMTSSFLLKSFKGYDAPTPQVKYNQNPLHVHFDEERVENVNYSDLFSGLKIVPLETSPESLIGSIADMQIDNDTIYIFDKFNSRSIFIYDKNGKFIRKISNVGKGPGEYVRPNNIYIYDNIISIYDSRLQKNLKYNKKGNLEEEVFLDRERFYVRDCIPLNDKYLIELDPFSTKSSEHFLQLIDKRSNALNSWLNLEQFNKGWYEPIRFNQTAFYRYNENIRHYNFFSDTVYSMTEQGIFPHLIIHAKNPLTLKDLKNFNNSDSDKVGSPNMQLAKLDKAFGLSNYLENNSTVYFQYRKGRRTYSVITAKKSNSSRICLLRNDMLQSETISAFNACTDEYFIQYYHEFQFTELKNKINSGEVVLSKENEKILDGISIQDNPVLFFFKEKS